MERGAGALPLSAPSASRPASGLRQAARAAEAVPPAASAARPARGAAWLAPPGRAPCGGGAGGGGIPTLIYPSPRRCG